MTTHANSSKVPRSGKLGFGRHFVLRAGTSVGRVENCVRGLVLVLEVTGGATRPSQVTAGHGSKIADYRWFLVGLGAGVVVRNWDGTWWPWLAVAGDAGATCHTFLWCKVVHRWSRGRTGGPRSRWVNTGHLGLQWVMRVNRGHDGSCDRRFHQVRQTTVQE